MQETTVDDNFFVVMTATILAGGAREVVRGAINLTAFSRAEALNLRDATQLRLGHNELEYIVLLDGNAEVLLTGPMLRQAVFRFEIEYRKS